MTDEPPTSRLPVVVSGVVVRGDGRGRAIGFPTANVAVPPGTALPSEGVYGARARRADGSCHVAAVSVGRRPTYYGDAGELLVEAYLLDFSGDLYGEELAVSIELLVRGQERFASTEALVAQMHVDCAAVAAQMAMPLEGEDPR